MSERHFSSEKNTENIPLKMERDLLLRNGQKNPLIAIRRK
jgi:hypothetical protein